VTRRPAPKRPEEHGDDELALFREAVRGATRLDVPERAPAAGAAPPPVPVQSLLDVHGALAESASGPIPWDESMETGEELAYLRRGLGSDVLKKLRRGHWVTQDQLDLHGLTRGQAQPLVSEFLSRSVKRGLRCVRIIHGKGLRSPGREPVLKAKIRVWLARRDEVLAFCQAPASEGGSGALLVLLKGRGRIETAA
jgi:DNA-nicking Smr family endonuclease